MNDDFDPIAGTPGRAMIDVAVIERDHRATIAKLRTLMQDAQAKADEAAEIGTPGNQAFWLGYKDGLLRSISTMEGRDHSPS